MKHHLRYLNYVLMHKWYVAIAGYRLGVSWHQIIFHDLSKFGPSEWNAYVDYFHRYRDRRTPLIQSKFRRAWLHHLHHNRHHAGHWSLFGDNGTVDLVPMPIKYINEMVADWAGAGKAITGGWEVVQWYERNKNRIPLHPDTRDLVELLLFRVGNDF